MFTKRLFAIGLLTALALATWTEARAGVALGTLEGGVINKLEDNDFETVINNVGLATTVDTGDYLVGMFYVQGVKAPPFDTLVPLTTADTFAGVFIVEVTKAGSGPYTYSFAPVASTVWTGLGLPAVATGTMVTLFEDNNGDIFDSDAAQAAAGLGGAGGVLESVSDDLLLWEFGFTGASGAATGDEFWTAVSNIDSVAGDGTLLTFSYTAGLNVTFQGAGPLLDPHNFLGYAGPTDLQVQGFKEAGPFQPTSPLPVITDTDLYISPIIPEPSSVVAWALLGLIGGGWSLGKYRRRAATA